MECTNLKVRSPKKAAQDIRINEAGSNPPSRRGDEFPQDKGKRKKYIAKKGVVVEAKIEWTEPEDDQPLI